MQDRAIRLWWLALAAALIPLITIHLTYLVSVVEGHVALCVPYWDSCTSISRTGRHGTAYFIFKGTMLPAAMLGLLYWILNGFWLKHLGVGPRARVWVPLLGVTSCLALGAYTVALGHEGDGFNLMRRIGVVVYLSFTFLCELLISGALCQHPRWQRQGRRMLWLSELVLLVGIASVILNAVSPDLYHRTDNAFEWVFALLINLHALWIAWLWRQSGFRGRLWTR
ncbi:hypothetical protein [Marinobacter sp. F4216]|uniref:hypothetical protein n=1 Tax=Marinobacter sp. F4216 TaxID=2874281 RepID=UPI001CBCF85E|nr:hypothetical protein [Marinobacter sp. F4216]MBZ2169775.1 hypothetical protein [Marinobacter sp. F4216]